MLGVVVVVVVVRLVEEVVRVRVVEVKGVVLVLLVVVGGVLVVVRLMQRACRCVMVVPPGYRPEFGAGPSRALGPGNPCRHLGEGGRLGPSIQFHLRSGC